MMKARELVMAAHSDAVSLLGGVADELPVPIGSPRLICTRCRREHARHSIAAVLRYGGTLGVDVLGDTSIAKLAAAIAATAGKEPSRSSPVRC